MTVQRKVTVQVDLKATGNLGRVLETNKQQATALARATDAGRSPVNAVPRQIPVRGALQNPATGQPMTGLATDQFMSAMGKASAGFGLLIGVTAGVIRAFTLVGDRATIAANNVARMEANRNTVATALQGQRMTREQYERSLPAEFRARLEAAPADQRRQMLEAERARLNSLGATNAQMSQRGAAVQRNLEAQRNIPLAVQTQSWWQTALFGANAAGVADQAGQMAGMGTSISREAARLEGIRGALRESGVDRDTGDRLLAQIRESGIDLGAVTLDDATVQRVTQIASGQAETESRVAGQAAINQVLREGVPDVIPVDQANRARMAQVNVGFFESGQFYDRMVEAMHRPEQADTQQRLNEILTNLNNTIGTLNTRLPAPTGPGSNDGQTS